jgi:DNA-binding transcriptional regulator YiaG
MSFRDDIKEARHTAGLTQSDAAATLRIAKRALQHWEDGKREPIYPAQVGALALLHDRKTKRLRGPSNK